ncbi:MAG TPA: ATP-dependent sacrificial sulfur transferase LarE [Nitratidesulfovibrio sp.]|nr:ATP-dependent sacrificial sulfur transferase LarE [Nitratidesulfovibrio sp.]
MSSTDPTPAQPNALSDALPPALLRLLATMPELAVALSGGLDSRFLTHAALLAGCRVTALHITGPHMPPRETEEARRWATARGATFIPVALNPLTIPAIAAGNRDRCYHCKHAAFTALLATAAPLSLCDGTNADDLTAYRPGLRALRELGIRSPLAEAGLSKADIRALAARTGLDRPDQAARPCLLTRLAYGMQPDAATLARLAAAENALEDLGLWDFRLRLAPDAPPRLQIGPAHAGHGDPASIPTQDVLLPILARHGFGDATIDTDGPVSGYFDR